MKNMFESDKEADLIVRKAKEKGNFIISSAEERCQKIWNKFHSISHCKSDKNTILKIVNSRCRRIRAEAIILSRRELSKAQEKAEKIRNKLY